MDGIRPERGMKWRDSIGGILKCRAFSCILGNEIIYSSYADCLK